MAKITKEVTAVVPERKNAQGEVTQEQLGPVTVTVEYADTVEEAVEMHGAEALLSNAFANWRVTLQGNIRSALKKGELGDSIAERLSTARMNVAQVGGKVDAEAAFRQKFMQADEAERAAMIERLKSLAG